MTWRLFTVVSFMALLVGVLLTEGACSSNDEGACVTVSTDCKPIVSPPTFDAIYSNIIKPSCATGTGRCHNEYASGGMDLRTIDGAFQNLSSRVDPKDLGCSLVERRLESPYADYRMPPGNMPLSEAQRCAIRQWIANGAQR